MAGMRKGQPFSQNNFTYEESNDLPLYAGPAPLTGHMPKI